MRTLTCCRFCGASLRLVFDLRESPVANALYATAEAARAASRFPLALMACQGCGLYQLSVALDKDVLFGPSYVYATPVSKTLSRHYSIVLEELLWRIWSAAKPMVVEIGSNNGAFLKAVKTHYDYDAADVLGIEPSLSVAKLAVADGIPTRTDFFGLTAAHHILATIDRPADLVVARHCFAHIDDIHDIVEGMKLLLAPTGRIYIENAYVVDTFAKTEIDQLYHEHMSYLTLGAMDRLFAHHGLRLIDAAHFPEVHGGAIGMVAVHADADEDTTPELRTALHAEAVAFSLGLEEHFVERVKRHLARIHDLVARALVHGPVDAFGATAKSVTLLHAAGLTAHHIRQVLDGSPLKQGKFMPGTGIPIVAKSAWAASPPSLAVLTAWNYEGEIRAEPEAAAYVEQGGQFLVPVPQPRVV